MPAAFGYRRPQALGEVFELLDRHRGAARLLAGGTDLTVGLNNGTLRPGLLVDLKQVAELAGGIEVADGVVRVAALTVLADLAAHPVLRQRFPALVEAAATVGSVQIRNRATLAGNVCNASPAADTVPALLVYQAAAVLAGADGTRRLPLPEFFRGPRRTALRPGEVLVAIELPLPAEPAGAAFARLTRRRGVDLATVSVAVLVDGTGVTRLGLGAVAPTPLLVADPTGRLADPATDRGERERLLAGLLAAADPISDVRAGRDYRLAMLAVLAGRCLATAVARRGQEER